MRATTAITFLNEMAAAGVEGVSQYIGMAPQTKTPNMTGIQQMGPDRRT